jgi:hypothetical protein
VRVSVCVCVSRWRSRKLVVWVLSFDLLPPRGFPPVLFFSVVRRGFAQRIF